MITTNKGKTECKGNKEELLADLAITMVYLMKNENVPKETFLKLAMSLDLIKEVNIKQAEVEQWKN